MQRADLEAALAHPTWRMGTKNTIDSATMMNKGLEVIEASRLFGFGGDRVLIVVHPQSIAHGFVVFTDGSVKSQLAAPDMRLADRLRPRVPRSAGRAPNRQLPRSMRNRTCSGLWEQSKRRGPCATNSRRRTRSDSPAWPWPTTPWPAAERCRRCSPLQTKSRCARLLRVGLHLGASRRSSRQPWSGPDRQNSLSTGSVAPIGRPGPTRK